MQKKEKIVLLNLTDNAKLRIESITNDNGDIMSLIYEAIDFAQGECASILKEVLSILDRQNETIEEIGKYCDSMKDKINAFAEE